MLREKVQSKLIWQTNKETWAKILQEFTFWYLENPLKINKATEDLAALVRTLRHRYPSNSPNLKLNNELFVIPARVINDDREVPKPYIILKI